MPSPCWGWGVPCALAAICWTEITHLAVGDCAAGRRPAAERPDCAAGRRSAAGRLDAGQRMQRARDEQSESVWPVGLQQGRQAERASPCRSCDACVGWPRGVRGKRQAGVDKGAKFPEDVTGEVRVVPWGMKEGGRTLPQLPGNYSKSSCMYGKCNRGAKRARS